MEIEPRIIAIVEEEKELNFNNGEPTDRLCSYLIRNGREIANKRSESQDKETLLISVAKLLLCNLESKKSWEKPSIFSCAQ